MPGKPSPATRDLIGSARAAARRAHAPYSGFRVGAALRDARGRIFAGTNIENACYPLGICAERATLLAWRAAGGAAIREFAIVTPSSNPAPPCGLCRDALLRWAPEAAVYLANGRQVVGPFHPRDWLPLRGGPGRTGKQP